MSEPTTRPAIFLDRDGVLNVYLPGEYVTKPAELKLLPGVGAAVRALNEAGLPVLLVSNQQGVAKGLMTDADLEIVDQALRASLAADGGTIGQSYYCPHAKSAGCSCRKPQAGLLLQAAADHHIDLAASTFVGDTDTDSAAARAAGVGRFILVLTGKLTAADAARLTPPPDAVVPTLSDAVALILGRA